MDSKKLRNLLAIVILSIFFINFLGHTFYWYYSIWYFDMIMHFLGGLWVGMLFFYIFPSKDSLSVVAKSLLFVLFIGIGWEAYEAIVNLLTVRSNFNYPDTFSDIFFDVTGGLCAILYIWKKQQVRQSELLFAEEQAR